jgi:capsular polysaccharide biosynthesis protein
MNSASTFFEVATVLRRQAGVVAVIVASGLALAAAAFFLSHTHYTATSTMLMVSEAPAYDAQHASLLTAKPLQAIDMASLVTSDTVLLHLRRQLGEDISLDKISKRLRAKSNGESTVMPIQYTDISKRGAIRGANLVASDVSAFYRNLATQRIDTLIDDLSRQTKTHSRALEKLDAQLQATAREYPYIDTKADDEYSIYVRMITLGVMRDNVTAMVAADESGLRASAGYLENTRPVALRDVTESDPLYNNIRAAYGKDAAQLQRVQSFGSENYPGLPELKDMVSQDRTALGVAKHAAASPGPDSNAAYATARDNVTRAQAVLASDRSKKTEFDRELSQMGSQLSAGGIGIKVARIRRHRDREENLYTTLELRLMQAIGDRAEAAAESSLIVMDPAQNANVAIWSTGLFAAIGILLLSLWLAFTLAMERDRADRRFRTADDIESAYNSPVIGALT